VDRTAIPRRLDTRGAAARSARGVLIDALDRRRAFEVAQIRQVPLDRGGRLLVVQGADPLGRSRPVLGPRHRTARRDRTRGSSPGNTRPRTTPCFLAGEADRPLHRPHGYLAWRRAASPPVARCATLRLALRARCGTRTRGRPLRTLRSRATRPSVSHFVLAPGPALRLDQPTAGARAFRAWPLALRSRPPSGPALTSRPLRGMAATEEGAAMLAPGLRLRLRLPRSGSAFSVAAPPPRRLIGAGWFRSFASVSRLRSFLNHAQYTRAIRRSERESFRPGRSESSCCPPPALRRRDAVARSVHAAASRAARGPARALDKWPADFAERSR